MSDQQEDLEDVGRTAVFDAAVDALEGRRDEEGLTEVTEFVTATEIASVTGIDKEDVVDALDSLGDGRLYVRRDHGRDEPVVIGVDHRNPDGSLATDDGSGQDVDGDG